MTTNLEFFKRSGLIYVEYKGQEYTMGDFLQLSEAKQIINKIYQKIFMDYSEDIRKDVESLSSKGQVVGAFIKKHFLKADRTFDVVIYEESNVIKFNLES